MLCAQKSNTCGQEGSVLSENKCHSVILIIIMLINYNSSYRFTLLDNSLSFYVKDKGDKAVGFMLLFEFSGMTSPSS